MSSNLILKILKDEKLQFSEHEEKVFLDGSEIPCTRGRISISLMYLYTSILSPREMYFAYHNDVISLNDTHFCPLRCAALARDCQNYANVSIDESEGCS